MDEDDISQHYDHSNRAFLQAFLARGTMTFAQAQPILAAIFTAQDRFNHENHYNDTSSSSSSSRGPPEPTRPEQVTVEDFESYVSAASAALSPLDMEIRGATHQATRERVYALVNTTSDAATQMATLRSAEEMAFVRRVIDAMFDRYNTPRMEALCLDGMQANKLRTPPRGGGEEDGANQSLVGGGGGGGDGEGGGGGEGGENGTQAAPLKGLKSSEVEQVMRGLVDEGWFERSRAGFYSLSPRALTELRGWLVDAYNDAEAGEGEWQRVKFCAACRDIVTVGRRCADRDCVLRLHDACQDAFWRAARDKTCPRCGTAWDGRHYVGERAITETEAYQRGRRRSGRSSLAERVVQDEEEEEDGEEEEGDGEVDGEDSG